MVSPYRPGRNEFVASTGSCWRKLRSRGVVPKWMPLGGAFSAIFTGIAFVLAGLGIVLDVLAARLLGLMLLVFSALALTPMIFACPHEPYDVRRKCVELDSDWSRLDRRGFAGN
jgi:hypothetical protein